MLLKLLILNYLNCGLEIKVDSKEQFAEPYATTHCFTGNIGEKK